MLLGNLLRRNKDKPEKKNTQFEEIEEYRDLLDEPDEFVDGFNSKTIVGALFVSIVMVPGNIYLDLMIGGSIGAAAQWVTIILFIELAKRSFTILKRQEVYLLYYVTSSLVNRESNAFEGLLWHQYFVQSPAVAQFGIQKALGELWWYAPPANSEALIERTFLHADWFWPIAFLVLGTIMGRIAWFTASYVLFRITSDYENLPFPFAPINAHGAMALAEESSGDITWRWRMFSIGAVIGVVWGDALCSCTGYYGCVYGTARAAYSYSLGRFYTIHGLFFTRDTPGLHPTSGTHFYGFSRPLLGGDRILCRGGYPHNCKPTIT